MKISDLPKGTYAGVRFGKSTVNALEKYNKDNNINNPVVPSEFHTTLLYSRKYLPNYTAKGKIDPPYIATPIRFDLWKPQSGNKMALVLIINCPELILRHSFLMREHSATYDYPEYIPHITLSYDAGINIDLNRLPQFTNEIRIIEEYSSELME